MKGFTLIETIILIIVMAIVVPAVMIGLNTMVIQSNKAEKLTIATDLARHHMELALSKRYDEVIPGTSGAQPAWSATLGVDGGETSGTMTTYDDVDDFNSGITNLPIPGFSDYTLTMTVAYFTDNNATTGIWGASDCTGACVPPTNAKRIRVTVNNALIGNVTLDCVTGALY